MKNVIRRSIRAAIRFTVHTVIETLDHLLADLFRMIDASRALVIDYTKKDGTRSTRTILPSRFVLSQAGDISIRAYDLDAADDRTFRVDRINAYQLTF